MAYSYRGSKQEQLDRCREETVTTTELQKSVYALQGEAKLKRWTKSLSCDCETTEKAAGAVRNVTNRSHGQ